MKSVVSQRLEERRKELKMTQGELGKVCGLTPSAISQFESGVRIPSFTSLLKLCSALNVTSDFLVGVKERDFQDLLADERIVEMMEGMLTLPEEHKDMLFRVYQGLALDIGEYERHASTG